MTDKYRSLKRFKTYVGEHFTEFEYTFKEETDKDLMRKSKNELVKIIQEMRQESQTQSKRNRIELIQQIGFLSSVYTLMSSLGLSIEFHKEIDGSESPYMRNMVYLSYANQAIQLFGVYQLQKMLTVQKISKSSHVSKNVLNQIWQTIVSFNIVVDLCSIVINILLWINLGFVNWAIFIINILQRLFTQKKSLDMIKLSHQLKQGIQIVALNKEWRKPRDEEQKLSISEDVPYELRQKIGHNLVTYLQRYPQQSLPMVKEFIDLQDTDLWTQFANKHHFHLSVLFPAHRKYYGQFNIADSMTNYQLTIKQLEDGSSAPIKNKLTNLQNGFEQVLIFGQNYYDGVNIIIGASAMQDKQSMIKGSYVIFEGNKYGYGRRSIKDLEGNITHQHGKFDFWADQLVTHQEYLKTYKNI